MTDLAQLLAVAVIGAVALAYVLRQLGRRLRPQPSQKAPACGGCSGCSGGGCGSARR